MHNIELNPTSPTDLQIVWKYFIACKFTLVSANV